MNELRSILKEIIGLTENEWEQFYNQLKRQEYKAKTLLIKEGKTAKNLYFIECGLLRT